ncbi:MAG: sensor domain-containing diguanylate cyclase [Anaerolineae bacterium]|nr:sensor domain-containing diguanylate cyclase [Anaerolineae bacterium]MCI0609360.1 sensor domain-containing diguanylate cyclase [Anaerolineae bacterium]
MKNRKPVASFAPIEVRRFILPLTLTTIFLMVGIILDSTLVDPRNITLIVYGVAWIFITLIYDFLIAKSTVFHGSFSWFYVITIIIGLGLLNYILPPHLNEIFYLMVIFSTISMATVSGRYQAYLTLIGILAISLPNHAQNFENIKNILDTFAPFVISIVSLEAILRIKDTTQQHIHRLETINRVSSQIMLSLDTEQTMSLLTTAIQDALEADTYFIGIVKDNEIHLDLFYDDGEYFNGTRAPLDGTLSGWVIKNQKELFLHDLRKDITLDGVKNFVIGKEKTSLSWMGVPLKSVNVTGIIALGSYKPNAFDRADMELFSNLAQHVTLALSNTFQHAQVEEQARLDSLTGVYNHGYFLKRLAEQADESSNTGIPLSLIMMDIDYFKQYNDTFGHLVGDQILNTLCAAIKQHIKQTDAVGRWGGEEFIISLPGASGAQAMQVAQRIGQTMSGLRVEDMEQRTVPVPTVSQGIAVFPDEANEIYRLIDLADQRLYIAKERGRNQIEPKSDHWEKIQTEQKT